MFSMSYLSSAERLTVVVAKARNLRHVEDGKITLGELPGACKSNLGSFLFNMFEYVLVIGV